ncbi:MAG: SPFH domain-containing protein [Actinomycetia bacterium]|nr:SPFH domain-containing protein [Actinomycetes bacterium]
MAIIKNYLAVSHFQGTPTAYAVHLRQGEVVHEGVGRAFWFRPATSALSEVPVTDQELPLMVHAATCDHQVVSVQIGLTYRFADPTVAAGRLDFGIVPPRTPDAPDGRTQAAAVLAGLAQSLVVADVRERPLDAVVVGLERLKDVLAGGFAADVRLRETGVALVDLHVLAIRPSADIEKALQTPLRERLQSEADAATYERRALAVERERTISENELASKIELAVRTERLVAQEGANARRRAEEEAAAALIAAQAEAERRRLEAESEAAAIRLKGAAEGERTAAQMAAYAGIDEGKLSSLALRDLAQGLRGLHLEHLTITPDLLTQALAGLRR